MPFSILLSHCLGGLVGTGTREPLCFCNVCILHRSSSACIVLFEKLLFISSVHDGVRFQPWVETMSTKRVISQESQLIKMMNRSFCTHKITRRDKSRGPAPPSEQSPSCRIPDQLCTFHSLDQASLSLRVSSRLICSSDAVQNDGHAPGHPGELRGR